MCPSKLIRFDEYGYKRCEAAKGSVDRAEARRGAGPESRACYVVGNQRLALAKAGLSMSLT